METSLNNPVASASPKSILEEAEIIIVGAGFAGLGMGIQLQKAKKSSFLILERANEIGGTWRDNTYPGAACDVPTHLYSYSFEPNPKWKFLYGRQQEILEYNHHCVNKYGLTPHLRLDCAIQQATFEEKKGQWHLIAKDGREFRARVLINATGPLNKWSFPNISGREEFSGSQFHTAAWDHSFAHKGKKIAVIGTGASAIQVIPAIGPDVAELFVFQRTPAWVIPRPDRRTPKFEQGLYRLFPFLQYFHRGFIYWSQEMTARGFTRSPKFMRFASKLAKWNLKRAIKDPELRKKLTPNYTMGCKRLALSNEYYPALARKNVHLLTETIQSITAKGILTADGIEHEVDGIVYATGFDAAENQAPFDFHGRPNRNLKTEWSKGGEAYLGTTVHGFPNFFILIGPNTGLGHSSMIHIMESQFRYILSGLTFMEEEKAKLFEIKPDVQAAFNHEIQERLKKSVWVQGGCKAWYSNSEGKNTTIWPGSTVAFRRRLKRFKPTEYLIEK